MRAPRLLVVAGGPRSTASTRHRLWNYRPFLEADGIDLTWVEYQGGREASMIRALAHRVGVVRDLLRTAGGQDVVLVQKVLPPPYLFRKWKAAGARVVYDFDDALYARAVTGESEETWKRRKARFDHALDVSDVVIAGSPPLAEYARERGTRVEVMYPSLDRARFPQRPTPQQPPGHVVLGWIGNDQSQVYLKALDPVLTRLFRDRPQARIAICSSVPPELSPGLRGRMDFIPWSEAGELAAASSFDVAISPLGPEVWSRARGGRVSVLLSMASGVPVVASPGGGVGELVGDTGGVLFADDPETWHDHLAHLMDDPSERVRHGVLARSVIDRGIWSEVQYPRLKHLLFGGG